MSHLKIKLNFPNFLFEIFRWWKRILFYHVWECSIGMSQVWIILRFFFKEFYAWCQTLFYRWVVGCDSFEIDSIFWQNCYNNKMTYMKNWMFQTPTYTCNFLYLPYTQGFTPGSGLPKVSYPTLPPCNHLPYSGVP